MIKSSEQRIREYLVMNPLATRDEVKSKVFLGYVGGRHSKERKALDNIFHTTIREQISVDNFDMLNNVL